MSIFTNLSKLSKLARSTIKLTIEQESSTCNNNLIYNWINYYHIWHCWCDHWSYHNLCHLHKYVININQVIKLSLKFLCCMIYIKLKTVRVVNRHTN